MQTIPESGTLRMFEIANRLEAEGHRIYHFEVGQPDFPTPSNIVNAAVDALKRDFTKYVSARGIPQLLDAIASMYATRGIPVSGNKNVVVTTGAKMALFMGVLATIDSGDDVLVLSPDWPTYRVMIRAAGGNPVPVPTGPDYALDEEVLKSKITDRCTCLIANSPNNPTGGILQKDDLKTIFDLAADHDFVVFSDEIYESLVYDGLSQTSMLEIDPAMERTLVINGFSKAYSMTGWRLGYAIGNAETINNMVRIQQNTTSCATSFVQSAGVEALRGDQSSVEKMRRVYEKRRNRMVELLSDIDGVKCTKPRGAFYVFPDFSSYGITSERLAEIILRDIGAVCTPGHEFGEQCDYNLRLSYATSMEVIEEGAAMLKKYLESLEQAVRPTGTKRAH